MANSDEIRPRHKRQHQVLRVPQGLWTSHGQLYTTEKRDRILNTTRIPPEFHISREPSPEPGPKQGPESEPCPNSAAAASANDDSAPTTPWRDPCDLWRIRGRNLVRLGRPTCVASDQQKWGKYKQYPNCRDSTIQSRSLTQTWRDSSTPMTTH